MLRVRPKTDADIGLLLPRWNERWARGIIVSHGVVFEPSKLPGFVCVNVAELLGALTYDFSGGDLEVVTLDSFVENKGAGTALLDAAIAEGRMLGARRAWLLTSNDNIRALRFYQCRGWNMVAVHRDAITAARSIKPEIPLASDEGIPLRHEIEFEYIL